MVQKSEKKEIVVLDSGLLTSYSLPPIISKAPRKWFWWHFLLMLGIHARIILWGMTKCPRVDAKSEISNKGHSKVKGQIGAFLH